MRAPQSVPEKTNRSISFVQSATGHEKPEYYYPEKTNRSISFVQSTRNKALLWLQLRGRLRARCVGPAAG